MADQLLHTPDGVRDIYSDEYERKRVLEQRIEEQMRRFGYHPIQTPTFEYFDVFGNETGMTPATDLYKFFDSEGNTLVLRPDYTPAIARCAATYAAGSDTPTRLFYHGSTFVNNSTYQGYLKESTQSGAELIGDGSVEADAEMIALSVEVLRCAGLTDFQLSIGHVDFLNGLFEAACLGPETEKEIRELLLNRNFYGVEDRIAHAEMDDDLRELFGLLRDVMLTRDKLAEAEARAARYPKIAGALRRLQQLEDLLRVYGVADVVFYEMAMVLELHYYTGIIFSAYTFGSGEAVLKGGRYDHLLASFGVSSPAIGFAVGIEAMMRALQHQSIPIPFDTATRWLVYDATQRERAIRDATAARSAGERVELVPRAKGKSDADYRRMAAQNPGTEVVFYTGEDACDI